MSDPYRPGYLAPLIPGKTSSPRIKTSFLPGGGFIILCSFVCLLAIAIGAIYERDRISTAFKKLFGPAFTQTLTYTLKCNINTENFGFEITGETGTVVTTYNNETKHYDYDSSGQMSEITVAVNRDLLFENNQHRYHIEGTITVKQTTNEVTYDITATGDTFGNSLQTCKKP
jgi:hypothetical protein